jgi:hypothetical protein
VKLSRKSSWSFKRSLYSRKTSGGPGYIKGSKIITGDIQGSEKTQAIKMKKGPFKVRGADNFGECYMVKEPLFALSQDLPNGFKVVKPDEEVYYDDPDLTFADSIVYGCKLRLTFDEFFTFCDSK